jgi:toxin YoeB
LRRVNRLIRDIDRNGYQTTGDPGCLRGDLSGSWSVRIDEANRLVFQFTGETLEIYACKSRYESPVPRPQVAQMPGFQRAQAGPRSQIGLVARAT